MPTRFTAKNVALVCCSAPLYTIFSLCSLFPVIGTMGKVITIAAIVSPLIRTLKAFGFEIGGK